MTISLRALYSEMDYMNIELLAGESGLDRPVKSFNIVENSRQSAALTEYELVLITGVEFQAADDLLSLLTSVAAAQVAGIIVICGSHITKVSDEAAELCRSYDMPLFEAMGSMPDILQLLCRKLMAAKVCEAELSSAVKHAIYFPQQKDLYMPFFQKNNLALTGAYCVAILDIAGEAERTIMPDKPEEILTGVKAKLVKLAGKAAAVCFENRILILFNGVELAKIKQLLQELMTVCSRLLGEGQRVYTAVGSIEQQPDMIHRSYRRAHDVLKLEKWRGSKVNAYDELGLYKLLLAIDDRSIIKSFDRETLLPLMEYDDLNNTDYVSVLACYLKTGGSLKETAAELFVHRNTVNYKIHKIEEVLGCNLSDADERLKYTIAFKIRDIL